MGLEIIGGMNAVLCRRIGAVTRSPMNHWTILMSNRFLLMLTGVAGHAPINGRMGLSSSTVMRAPRRSSGRLSGAMQRQRETDSCRFRLLVRI